MSTVYYQGTLVSTSCWCGIQFAIPNELYQHAHEDPSHNVYCPLGHSMIYKNTIREQLKAEQERRERAERRAQANRDLLEAEERSHSATRGHLTRTKKRVGRGVCPCCNRHFEKLERHMVSKHPDYKLGNGAS